MWVTRRADGSPSSVRLSIQIRRRRPSQSQQEGRTKGWPQEGKPEREVHVRTGAEGGGRHAPKDLLGRHAITCVRTPQARIRRNNKTLLRRRLEVRNTPSGLKTTKELVSTRQCASDSGPQKGEIIISSCHAPIEPAGVRLSTIQFFLSQFKNLSTLTIS